MLPGQFLSKFVRICFCRDFRRKNFTALLYLCQCCRDNQQNLVISWLLNEFAGKTPLGKATLGPLSRAPPWPAATGVRQTFPPTGSLSGRVTRVRLGEPQGRESAPSTRFGFTGAFAKGHTVPFRVSAAGQASFAVGCASLAPLLQRHILNDFPRKIFTHDTTAFYSEAKITEYFNWIEFVLSKTLIVLTRMNASVFQNYRAGF